MFADPAAHAIGAEISSVPIESALPACTAAATRLDRIDRRGHIVGAHDARAVEHRHDGERDTACNRSPEPAPGQLARASTCATGPPPRGQSASRERSSSMSAATARLCASVLPKPKPGSIAMRSRGDAGRAAACNALRQERLDLAHDIVIVRRRSACVRGSPCMCMRHTRALRCRLPPPARPASRSARTSLMMPAPAAAAARITSGLLVSTEITAPVSRPRALDHRDNTRRSSSSHADRRRHPDAWTRPRRR